MRISEAFGQMVTDAMVPYAIADVARMTGISKTYLGEMKKGAVPESVKIAQFASGMKLDIAPFYEAAKEALVNTDPEKLLHLACLEAGMSNQDRLDVLAYFRSKAPKTP